jgi:RNA polymerase sigma-70 factor (ECF subfamily)
MDALQTNGRNPVSEIQLTSLIEEARNGNRFAFQQLIDHFQHDIYRMVFFRTRSRMDAEDLTQDVFIKAYQNISSLREADRFRSWLYRIAVNRVRDFHRQQKVRALYMAVVEPIESHLPERLRHKETEAIDRLQKEDFWKQIGLLLTRLSSMEREVFLLRFFDQFNIREISETLKKSESTIKTHLYRALTKVKAENALLKTLRDETMA